MKGLKKYGSCHILNSIFSSSDFYESKTLTNDVNSRISFSVVEFYPSIGHLDFMKRLVTPSTSIQAGDDIS